MNNIEAYFNFVKSANWVDPVPGPTPTPVDNPIGWAAGGTSGSHLTGASATGDSLLAIILLLLALIVVVGIFVIVFRKRMPIYSKAKLMLENQCKNFPLFYRFRKRFKSICAGCGIFVAMLAVTFVSFNYFFATAETTQECSMSDITVSITNTGIESVDNAILKNNSPDLDFYADTLKLNSLAEAAKGSVWTFKNNGDVIFNAPTDQTVRLKEPIKIPPSGSTTFEVGIEMDANAAISLINKPAVSLNFGLIDAIHFDAHESINTTVVEVESGVNLFSGLSDELKEQVQGQIDTLQNSAKNTINQLSDKQQIDVVIEDFNNQILTVYSNAAVTNVDCLANDFDSTLESLRNLNTKKQEFYQMRSESIKNTFSNSIARAHQTSEVTIANHTAQTAYVELKQDAVTTDATSSWGIHYFRAEDDEYMQQSRKYGELLIKPLDPSAPYGKEFAGWYTDTDYTLEWDFDNDKVGMTYGSDSENCTVVLYAKWKDASYTVTFNRNGYGNDPVPDKITVEFGGKYGDHGQWPEDLTDSNNDFEGWYLTQSCTGDPITQDDEVITKGDHNLYAKWTSRTPKTLTFVATGCQETPSAITGIPKYSTYSTDGNTLTVTCPSGKTFPDGQTTKTATVSPATGYDNIITWDPPTGTFNDDLSVNVSFLSQRTITFTNTSGCMSGNVPQPVTNVPNGSTWSVDASDGNKLMIAKKDGTIIDVTVQSPGDAYEDIATWNPISGTVSDNVSIDIDFKKKCKMSFNVKDCSVPELPAIENIPNGSTYQTVGNTLTIYKPDMSPFGSPVTVAPPTGEESSYEATATWTPASGEINGDLTVSVMFNKLCTIQFSCDPSCNPSVLDPICGIKKGSSFGVNGNQIVVYDPSGDPSGDKYSDEVSAVDGTYDNVAIWSINGEEVKEGTITEEITTINVKFKKLANIKFTCGDGCSESSLNPISNIRAGSTYKVVGNSFEVIDVDGSTQVGFVSVTCADTSTYDDISIWEIDGEIISSDPVSITFEGEKTVNVSFLKKRSMTFVPTGCQDNEYLNNGIQNIPNGSILNISGNDLSVLYSDGLNITTIASFTVSAADGYSGTAQWEYNGEPISEQITITEDMEIYVSFQPPQPKEGRIPLFVKNSSGETEASWWPLFKCNDGQTAADIGYHFYADSQTDDEITTFDGSPITKIEDLSNYIGQQRGIWLKLDDGCGIKGTGKVMGIRFLSPVSWSDATNGVEFKNNCATSYGGGSNKLPQEYWCGLAWTNATESTKITYSDGGKTSLDSGLTLEDISKSIVSDTNTILSCLKKDDSTIYAGAPGESELHELSASFVKGVGVAFTMVFDTKNPSLLTSYTFDNSNWNVDFDENQDDDQGAVDNEESLSATDLLLNSNALPKVDIVGTKGSTSDDKSDTSATKESKTETKAKAADATSNDKTIDNVKEQVESAIADVAKSSESSLKAPELKTSVMDVFNWIFTLKWFMLF